MSDKHYFVTTPIYYVNAEPHLGSSYTSLLADTLSRFYEWRGYETFFLTGVDEHGLKISQAAAAHKVTPQAFTDRMADIYRNTWADLGLKYDRFIRTTEEQHKRVVSGILQKVFDKGDIYAGDYEGLYCIGCEQFYTDKELINGKCPTHQTEAVKIKERNYFFKMEKYRETLIEHINSNPEFVRPSGARNELLAMLREPIEDLCISRPKARLEWGIPLPFDPEYTTYVWFDALINYITGIGYPDDRNFNAWWDNSEHLIGKDILKPHGIFWPTMLFSLGLHPVKHLTVHGFWVTPTGKMSKSLGNVVNPIEMKNKYGLDVLRYHIFREMTFGPDAVFSEEALVTRYNSDLANNLGNLVSRALAMTHRYRSGIVPAPASHDAQGEEIKQKIKATADSVCAHIENRELYRAIESIWSLIDTGNVYIDRCKPWALARSEGSEERVKKALDTSLYFQLEIIRVVGSMLTAFMPETSRKILELLGYTAKELGTQQSIEAVTNAPLSPGKSVKEGEAIFPRIEAKPQPAKSSAPADEQSLAESITIQQFGAIDLRVGQVLEADAVPKSEKLLKLKVDMGELGVRQILSGIAKQYSPDSMVGRKVAVVANLKPAKLMGLESQGMILAALDELDGVQLIEIPLTTPIGAKIR
jgi:methionyl-tRNA synthetase